jgi:glutamate carboxypeptidase
MKGGDVEIIEALDALNSVGALANKTITVLMTGDEEAAGDPLSVARAPLVDAAKHSDIALAFEGGNPHDATVARRGASSWLLTVHGRGAHSAGMFSRGAGYGAIYEAARVINEFRTQLAGQPDLTFSPSVIVGGTDVTYDSATVSGTAKSKLNIIASNVTVSGDLRFLTEGQKDSTRERMRAIATHDNLDGTSAAISFADEYPAMAPTPANYALLAIYDSASRALGYGPVTALDPGRRGAGDISFVAPMLTGLDGLGAMGSGAHTPAERVNLATLPLQTERAAILMYRLLQ